MSTSHHSSDQFPDAHLDSSYAHCLMESSSGHSNQKSTSFSTGCYWGGSGGGGSGSGDRFWTTFNLNNEDDREELGCDEQANNVDIDGEGNDMNMMGMDQFGRNEMEPLFEKPLTPSDVGKLNRLVIPKQHAERHFPISAGGGGGGDPGEKGFILSFEDEMGKLWRFRYSYWNSSQSYVLTKGWSRFVKEKRLDAGDFVLFARHRVDFDRFFIGWRRNSGEGSGVAQLSGGRGGVFNRSLYQGNPYPNQQHQGFSQAQQYQQDCLHAGSGSQNQTRGGGNSRRVRLFGVNLECQADESDPTDGSGHGPYNESQNHSHHQDHMGWP